MPIKSLETATIPDVSLPTWLFGSHFSDLPDSPLIIDPDAPGTRFLSLLSYRQWSQRLAAGLRNAGLQTGDKVLFASANHVAYPVVLMGVLMAGGVISGCSPTLEYEQFARQAQELMPTFIFATEAAYKSACRAATSISLEPDRVYLFNGSALFTEVSNNDGREATSSQCWSKLLKTTNQPFDWSPFTNADQLAAINYTSGSTGDLKGVMVTHRNFIANSSQYIKQQTQDPHGPENGGTITWVMWPPMYHVTGQTQFCMTAPKRGIRNYLMETFTLETILKLTAQYQATDLFLLPSFLIAMLSHPAATQSAQRMLEGLHYGIRRWIDSGISCQIKRWQSEKVGA